MKGDCKNTIPLIFTYFSYLRALPVAIDKNSSSNFDSLSLFSCPFYPNAIKTDLLSDQSDTFWCHQFIYAPCALPAYRVCASCGFSAFIGCPFVSRNGFVATISAANARPLPAQKKGNDQKHWKCQHKKKVHFVNACAPIPDQMRIFNIIFSAAFRIQLVKYVRWPVLWQPFAHVVFPSFRAREPFYFDMAFCRPIRAIFSLAFSLSIHVLYLPYKPSLHSKCKFGLACVCFFSLCIVHARTEWI